MRVSDWKKLVTMEREKKNYFFAVYEESPLPFDERESFKGLSYYAPDPSYRFKLPLHEHEQKSVLLIEDTKGNQRRFLRWGEFRFKVNGAYCTLQAYKSSSNDEQLFIPFRDATSGKETYGAGRYIDLAAERDRMIDGTWMLDFNEAYNPWCAYSENYACPFTPPENRLEVPIKAGEKNYVKQDTAR
jgi:uncharacterized protein (DUF1684 family)